MNGGSGFDILEKDLQTLVNETKKKHPAIKDMLMECISDLQENKKLLNITPNQPSRMGNNQGTGMNNSNQNSNSINQNKTDFSQATARVFKVIDALKEVSASKVQETVLSIIQRLINTNKITEEEQVIVLNYLFMMKDNKDDKLLIKVIQSLLVLLNPKLAIARSHQLFAKVMTICLSLCGTSIDIIVHNTSLVGVFQLTSIIFEQFIKSQRALEHPDSSVTTEGSQNSISEKEMLQQSNQFKTSEPSKHSEGEEKTGPNPFFSLEKCQQTIKTTVQIFNEIVSMMDGKTMPTWVPASSQQMQKYFKEIGMDLLLSVLKQAGQEIRKNEEMMQTIRNRVIPSVASDIHCDYLDFKLGIRTIKLASRIIYNLQVSAPQISSKIVSEVRSADKIYIFSYVFSEHFGMSLLDIGFVKELYTRFQTKDKDQLDKTLTDTFESLAAIASTLAVMPDVEIRKQFTSNVKSLIIDRNEVDFVDPPQISLNMLYKLLCTCTANFAQTLVLMFQERESNLLTLQRKQSQQIEGLGDIGSQQSYLLQQIPLQQQQQQQQQLLAGQKFKNRKRFEGFEDLIGLIESVWKMNLRIIKKLLSKQVTDQYTQTILKQIQTWVNITGTLRLYKITDEYLRVLQVSCVPQPPTLPTQQQTGGEEFNVFHLTSSKVLFNVAICLGNILGTSSWHIILQTMQNLDAVFQRKLMPEETRRSEDQLIMSELQILQSILSNIFSTSHQADDDLIITMMEGLNQLNLSGLEVAAIEQDGQQLNQMVLQSSQQLSQSQLKRQLVIDLQNPRFGLIKMQETMVVNMFRIDLFWDLSATHFLMLANKKYNNLRLFAIEVLNSIVNSAFDFFIALYSYNPNQPSVEVTIQEKENLQETQVKFSEQLAWNRRNWQSTVLSPYRDIITSSFPDNKATVLDNCVRLVQNYGHEINENGMRVILEVLQSISTCVEFPTIVVSGQKCLELIISSFIGILNINQLKVSLDLIDNFRRNSVDSNSIYQSVTLLWNIGDHLAKLQEAQQQGEQNPSTSSTSQLPQTTENVDYEQIWESLFLKLIQLTNEGSFELRQSAIQTLSQLISVNTKLFSKPFWVRILKEILISQIERLIQKIIEQNDEQLSSYPQAQCAHLQTPKFFGIPETPKFVLPSQSDRNLFASAMPTHFHERFNVKQLEASIIQLVGSLQKIIKKGMIVIVSIDDILVELFLHILSKLNIVILLNNQELVFEFFKLVKEFVVHKPSHAALVFEQIKLVIFDYFALIDYVGDNKLECRTASSEVLPTIGEIFIQFLQEQNNTETFNLSLIKSFVNFYRQSLIFCRRIENTTGFMKFQDDKQIFKLIESVEDLIFTKSVAVQNELLLFMNEIVNGQLEDRFDYLELKQFLLIFTKLLMHQAAQKDILVVFTKYLLTRMESLMQLRFDSAYHALHAKFPKSFEPLWLTTFKSFFNFVKSMISQKKHFDSSCFLIIENLLNKEKIGQLSSEVQMSVMKEVSGMESQCIECLIEVMLDKAEGIEDNIVKRIVQVFENYANSANLAIPSSEGTSEIIKDQFIARRKYLGNLFLLSQNSQIENTKLAEVAAVVFPVLVRKCKCIFEEFIAEEVANHPIGENRVGEIVYVLQQLKDLNSFSGCFQYKDPQNQNQSEGQVQNPIEGSEQQLENGESSQSNKQEIEVNKEKAEEGEDIPKEEVFNQEQKFIQVEVDNQFFKGKKAHLFYLFSLFTELITTNSAEIKVQLKEIFKAVQSEIETSSSCL